MTSKCPITNETCFQVEYGGERCVETPTLEDAARCIRKLKMLNSEMAHEIAAQDEIIERLRENKSSH